MKKILLFSLLITSAVNLYSQDKKSLESRAFEMNKHFVEQNYRFAVEEYTYPGSFKLMDKEDVIASFESSREFNDAEAEESGYQDYKIVRINIPPNFEYGIITKIDDGYYCYVSYDIASQFIYKDKINENRRAELVAGHKKINGAYEAYFDEKANAIVTKSKVVDVAVCNKISKNKWTFCSPSELDPALLSKIMTN